MPRLLTPLPRPLRRAAAPLALLAVAALAAADKPKVEEWKYDVVHRKKGVPLRGLVLEQTPAYVRMKCVSRKPGQAVILFTENVPRKDIARIDFLKDEEREILKDRLETLKRDWKALEAPLRGLDAKGKVPAKSAGAVALRRVPWRGDRKVEAYRYESTHFELVSNAQREVVELAALHLEHVYAAYARALPPRAAEAKRTQVLLTNSLDDYKDIARRRGLKLVNLAFYDPGTNQVVCFSDLERLAKDLEKLRRYHAELAGKLKARRAELAGIYRGKVPPELLAPLVAAEKQIPVTEHNNLLAFRKARQKLFQRLYHEAFHAYLATFVYPKKEEGTLPHWLDEGLAQVFQTAVLEAGELRLGHADEERLLAVRSAIARDKLVPVRDLLVSAPKNFLAEDRHSSDKHASDQHYLGAWALAHYLTFGRQPGREALDNYVKALKEDKDPEAAFVALVGEPLKDFEEKYRKYLKTLRREGTGGG